MAGHGFTPGEIDNIQCSLELRIVDIALDGIHSNPVLDEYIEKSHRLVFCCRESCAQNTIYQRIYFVEYSHCIPPWPLHQLFCGGDTFWKVFAAVRVSKGILPFSFPLPGMETVLLSYDGLWRD